MPFDFLRRRKGRAGRRRPDDPGPIARTATIDFDGLTEEWRLRGRMTVEGRLSDVLNRREPIPISDVSWAPGDGSAPFARAEGVRSVDPYDLILVLAADAHDQQQTDEERAAHRVHKIAYDVALDAPPYRVIGTVMLYPGSDPDRLLDRATEMFIPLLEPSAFVGGLELSDVPAGPILVNRSYLRGVEQVDRRTGERPLKLPGGPLGGVSWQERSR